MKKVLVTGAAGTIGIHTLRYLIEDGNYEITALDLKNQRSYRKLKKYRKMINIVNGDVNDPVLMDALVKDHDYIIHLAGILPPFADLKEDLPRIVDYEGTKNILRAISSYNPKCFLIYASSTTLYGDCKSKSITVDQKIVIDPDDNYSKYKAMTEEEIKSTIKNYTIFRLPALLCDPKKEAPMYHMVLDRNVELISAYDAGVAFAKAVESKKELKGKTFHLTGGAKNRVLFRDHLVRVLSIYGLSIRYLATLFLVDKNFYGGYYKDGDALEEILHFRSTTLDDYYEYIKKRTNRFWRFFPRLFVKPFLLSLKATKKKNQD